MPPLGAHLDENVPATLDAQLIRERLQAVSDRWTRLPLPAEAAAVRDAYRDLPEFTRQVRTEFRYLTAARNRQVEDDPTALLAAAFPTRGPSPTTTPVRTRPALGALAHRGTELER